MGDLVAVDPATRARSRLITACFCVSMEIGSTVPDRIILRSKHGNRSQGFVLESPALVCGHCRMVNIKVSSCGCKKIPVAHAGSDALNRVAPKPHASITASADKTQTEGVATVGWISEGEVTGDVWMKGVTTNTLEAQPRKSQSSQEERQTTTAHEVSVTPTQEIIVSLNDPFMQKSSHPDREFNEEIIESDQVQISEEILEWETDIEIGSPPAKMAGVEKQPSKKKKNPKDQAKKDRLSPTDGKEGAFRFSKSKFWGNYNSANSSSWEIDSEAEIVLDDLDTVRKVTPAVNSPFLEGKLEVVLDIENTNHENALEWHTITKKYYRRYKGGGIHRCTKEGCTLLHPY